MVLLNDLLALAKQTTRRGACMSIAQLVLDICHEIWGRTLAALSGTSLLGFHG